MADQTALIDGNSRQSMIGLLNTDGKTITRVQANPSNHGILVNDGATGSNSGGTFAVIDENGRTGLYAASNADDGTFVALYVDNTGALLVDSA